MLLAGRSSSTLEGLCQVCSGAKDKPNHKNPDKKGCPLADKLYCRTCVAEGNSARSRTHHTEVHINRKQAAKQGHLKKSKKDRDDKDPRGGQSQADRNPNQCPPCQPGGQLGYPVQPYYGQYWYNNQPMEAIPNQSGHAGIPGQLALAAPGQLALAAPGQDASLLQPHHQMNVYPMGGQYQVMSSNLQRLFQEDMYMYQLFSNDIDSIMLFSDRMCFQSIF